MDGLSSGNMDGLSSGNMDGPASGGNMDGPAPGHTDEPASGDMDGPSIPGPGGDGTRGVVMSAGGQVQVANAYGVIRTLRALGSK